MLNRGVIYIKRIKTLEWLEIVGNQVEKEVFMGVLCNLKMVWKLRMPSETKVKKNKKVKENIYQFGVFA